MQEVGLKVGDYVEISHSSLRVYSFEVMKVVA